VFGVHFWLSPPEKGDSRMALTPMGPRCRQRAEQPSGGRGVVLVVEAAEQEGADGPRMSGGVSMGPPMIPGPTGLPLGRPQHHAEHGESRRSGGAAGPPGSHSPRHARAARPGWGLPGAGTKRRRSCQAALYQITLPFSLLRHICSYCGRLPSPRVVVMKSLYLHKVIVHVIKKKEVILINVKSIP